MDHSLFTPERKSLEELTGTLTKEEAGEMLQLTDREFSGIKE